MDRILAGLIERERLVVRVVGCVLMDNHYHLLLETPDGPLSRPCQWLNVA